MRGGVKFGASCMVGNWFEDREIQRTIIKEFLAKKEMGTLKSDT